MLHFTLSFAFEYVTKNVNLKTTEKKHEFRFISFNFFFHFILSLSFCQQDIRANFTSPVARFAVSNLHPGSVYIISIYAFNSKGRSDPAVLPAAMLRPAEKQLTAEKGKRIVQMFH